MFPLPTTVLTTNSGMAAFTLAAATATAHRPIWSALTAPYLYFEGMETLHYKGVSFGFSTSRLSAAAAMAEAAPPFLRLSVGVLDSASALALADVLRSAIEEVTFSWRW